MGELKPCAHCGCEALLTCEQQVWCLYCGAATRYYDTDEQAIEAWNTRSERTCRNASESKYGGEFVCSECLMTMDLSGDECGYGSTMMFFEECKVGHRKKYELVRTLDMPNYCPNCGAKVVSE